MLPLRGHMNQHGFDLHAAARQEMMDQGFHPDFPPDSASQLAALRSRPAATPGPGIVDLRPLLWSSIDNDSSRDLDQAEVAERVNGGIRVLVAIADVDEDVPLRSPLDLHAAAETTSVYTGIQTFPMLPESLSTDLTSLNQDEDRLAIVTEMLVSPAGEVASSRVYRALIRNRAQLTYNGVGPWLEGTAAAPAKVASSAELASQLRLQDEAAQLLRAERNRLGALDLDRTEAEVVVAGGQVKVGIHRRNRATQLIENLMVGANGVMAETLRAAKVSSIRRVVRTPERWPRIVELAARYGEHLPAAPDAGALNQFLQKRKAVDPVHYADVSLAAVKLMGPGEYVLSRPGDPEQGHFALAAHTYSHSTAPNRRFPDLVTQRLIKSVLAGSPAPYSDAELDVIAKNCMLKEDAARKVERVMNKRLAAVALEDRIGEFFGAVVTGVTPRGVFVRILGVPADGLLLHPEGVDVGDQVRVKLVSVDPRRGYLDFVR